MSDLVILYNCASNTCIDAYHHAYSFTNILQPYLNAADMTMILHAKLILAYVSAILTDDDINKFLQLSSSSAECLITILGEASTSTNRKANGFTITELANGMNQLLVCGGNRRYLAKPILLPTVVSVLSCGNVQEQLASCKLLWNLIQDGAFKVTVNESDLPIIDLLEQLKESKELNLSSLASGELSNVKPIYVEFGMTVFCVSTIVDVPQIHTMKHFREASVCACSYYHDCHSQRSPNCAWPLTLLDDQHIVS